MVRAMLMLILFIWLSYWVLLRSWPAVAWVCRLWLLCSSFVAFLSLMPGTEWEPGWFLHQGLSWLFLQLLLQLLFGVYLNVTCVDRVKVDSSCIVLGIDERRWLTNSWLRNTTSTISYDRGRLTGIALDMFEITGLKWGMALQRLIFVIFATVEFRHFMSCLAGCHGFGWDWAHLLDFSIATRC